MNLIFKKKKKKFFLLNIILIIIKVYSVFRLRVRLHIMINDINSGSMSDFIFAFNFFWLALLNYIYNGYFDSIRKNIFEYHSLLILQIFVAIDLLYIYMSLSHMLV